MRGYMTMAQAFECGDNDIPFIDGQFNAKKDMTKKEIVDTVAPPFHYEDIWSDKWQVNTAEPKVLTVEAYLEKYNFYPDQFGFDIILDHFDAISRNGRLAEYQRPEQVELREAVKEWDSTPEVGDGSESRRRRSEALLKVSNAIRNLKPPTEHTEKEPEKPLLDIREVRKNTSRASWDELPESEKVLSADECFRIRHNIEIGASECHLSKPVYRNGFADGKSQGRLERNQELGSLVEAVCILHNVADHDSVSTHTQVVFNEFENLKPLKAE